MIVWLLWGDWNEDVRGETMIDFKERTGLVDVMLQQFVQENNAPATYNRGKDPIDTILTTRGVDIVGAGYLAFGEGAGDHRPLYIDVELSSVLGSELPPPTTYIARRLKCEDPRVVRAYNRAFKRFLINKGLDFDAHKLADRIQQPLSSHNQVEYERIDGLRIQGMAYVEKKCRELKMEESLGLLNWQDYGVVLRFGNWLDGASVIAKLVLKQFFERKERQRWRGLIQMWTMTQQPKIWGNYLHNIRNISQTVLIIGNTSNVN